MIKKDQGYLVVVEEEYDQSVKGMLWASNFHIIIRKDDSNIPHEPYLYMIPEKFAYCNHNLLEYKLPDRVLVDCNRGIAQIFINFGTEPNAYASDFELLHDWMDQTGLNDFTVIYAALDIDTRKNYQEFCDNKNMVPRAHVHVDGVSIKMKYTMAWGAVMPLQRRRFGYFTRNPENSFGPMMAYQIHRDPLLREQTFMTCDNRAPWDDPDAKVVKKEVIAHSCNKYGLPYEEQEIDNFISLLPINSRDIPDGPACVYTPYLYDACEFVIIRETNQKAESPGFFSEKIYKAFMGRKPFMLLGAGRMLDKLHELGYRTFPDFVDESYSCDDSKYMTQTILSEMRRLAQLDDMQFRKMIFDMHDIIEHNYEVFRKTIETGAFYL